MGTDRVVLGVQTEDYTFVAPDNGVLKYIFFEHPDCQVYRITNSDYFLPDVSRTFHGRDIFAPVAAHLARGVSLDNMGKIFQEYIRGKVDLCEVTSNQIKGKIIAFDRFGNGISNIEKEKIFSKKLQIQIQGLKLNRLSPSYQEIPVGEPLAIIGSCGTVEIGVNQGNAKEKLKLKIGDPVIIVYE